MTSSTDCGSRGRDCAAALVAVGTHRHVVLQRHEDHDGEWRPRAARQLPTPRRLPRHLIQRWHALLLSRRGHGRRRSATHSPRVRPAAIRSTPRRCLLPFPSNAYTKADTAADTGLRVEPAGRRACSPTRRRRDRPHGVEPQRRLQPEQHVARLRARPRCGRVEAAVVDRHRRVRRRTTRRWCSSTWPTASECRCGPSSMRRPPPTPTARLVDPPGDLRCRRVTRSPSAYAALKDSRRRDHRRLARVPRLPRPHHHDRRRSRPAGASMEKTFTALTAAGRHSQRPATGVGLHGRQHERNISERMLSIRDRALTTLGDKAPAFTITAVKPNTDDNIALHIEGTFTVPNFLTDDGGPGNRFNYAGQPPHPTRCPCRTRHPSRSTSCATSRVATMAGTEPAHLVEYGHGLLGSNDEINAGNVRDMSPTSTTSCTAPPSGPA